MKLIRTLALAGALLIALSTVAQNNPKREFRGVWIPTVGDRYYAKHTTAENKAYLLNMLDSLQMAGCNAIIFHCRPQADAFYQSELEPWSFWLSGTGGVPPTPVWDPMQMMIEESHKRGMELHAWINPYRVGYDHQLAPDALIKQHPEWFLKYGEQNYFDPAYPECREHICRVVADIVTRYDVDAIHMDDYFYPYPIEGKEFPDTASYDLYGIGWDRADWRRANVDSLILGMHRTIMDIKPWVRLGISPFGIWRNKASDPDGSDTNGLQCYDALYADCIKWTAEGWVDYMVPQLYWQLEHPKASDAVLMDWWNEHTYGRHMYYGLAIKNTMDYADTDDPTCPTQLDHKLRIMRSLDNVQGVTWWPCYSLTANYKGVTDSLMNGRQSTLALPPTYPWLDDVAPAEVKDLKVKKINKVKTLVWEPPKTDDPLQQAARFVVYRFVKGERIDLNNSKAIVAITSDTQLPLPQYAPKGKQFVFVVTALDHCNNESPHGTQTKVKL